MTINLIAARLSKSINLISLERLYSFKKIIRKLNKSKRACTKDAKQQNVGIFDYEYENLDVNVLPDRFVKLPNKVSA